MNGLLIASTGLAVSQSALLRPAAAQSPGGVCGDVIGDDPRILRSGNRPAAFNIGHWMRDNRLSFEPGAVTLAPGCDPHQGRFDIADDGGEFDVIIVGAGLSGLAAAFHLLQKRPGTRILLLEANHYAGGNAARDEGPPLPVPASTAGAFCSRPYGFFVDLYKELGIEWEKHLIEYPVVCYFFDEHTPGIRPGHRGWMEDSSLFTLENLKDAPFSPRVIRDLLKTIDAWKEWDKKTGGPDDPPDRSSPQYDYLSEITLADYLTNVLHCDPVVVDFYSNYTIDCMGGTAHYVSAHSAISFLSTEYAEKCFAYPGGTSEVALRLVQWLTKAEAGKDREIPEIRLNSIALRLETDGPASNPVSVTYYSDGQFHRAKGKTMIVATQASSARRLIEPLLDSEKKAAWDEFNTVPALVANIAVRNMAPFVKQELGYANYFWGSKYWSNFEIADWTTANHTKANRASVLTFYGGVSAPPEEFAAERMKLLQTPFSDYETSLRDDLSRVMRGSGFDFDRDVSAIFVYRWGHSMILPTTKSLFGNVHGPDGRLDRSKAPRRIACQPFGPISFAGQHTEGSPSAESAMGSGYRAADEVLSHL